MEREVYLDNSATTRVREEVAAVVLEAMTRQYGNPSSLHRKGIEAERLVQGAREIIARSLGVSSEEIYFTSGGTEANNLALKGAVLARSRRGKHIITTAIEHPSVLNTCAQLAEEGFRVTYLPVDKEGVIDPEELRSNLTPETILVSTMYINNEIGSVQPLDQIAAVLAGAGQDILWHVDAIQGYGKLPLKPRELGVHLVSISGHKLHAPKGTGALYVAGKVSLKPLFGGGEQEQGLRSGTENVPGIAGLGRAVELALAEQPGASARMKALKERLVAGLLERVPNARLNGPRDGAPHIANISFPGVQGETLVHALEEVGIYVSTGSACSSRQSKPSHVLTALGLGREEISSAIRFSLAPCNEAEEIEYVLERLPRVVADLRLFQRR